jgi:hypothetical protein
MNSEFYCNFNDGENRSWADAQKYGFISAGGGAVYSKPLNLLKPDNRVWVFVPRHGYVGVGRVVSVAEPASTFTVATPKGKRPVLNVAKRTHHRFDDADECEYFVGVDWIQRVPLAQAVWERGLFANRNVVCKPTAPSWRDTLKLLKKMFPAWDK